jgi:hypothetical protein
MRIAAGRFLLGFLVLGFVQLEIAREAHAVCGGSSPTWIAASAGRADVLDCVNAASSGDRINVPSGTATWSGPITLPVKDLEIFGSTVITCTGGSSSGAPVTCSAVNNTNLTCGTCFVLNLASAQRISGFSMPSATNGGIGTTGNQNPSKHFRIDHNRIAAGSWSPMEIEGDANCVHPQGIVDHNILVNVAIHSNGTDFTGVGDVPGGVCQHQLWAAPVVLGDSTGIVYIEANHFQGTSANINNADSNYGGRYVFRFNNITSGRHTAEIHGVQGDNRGSQRTEVYENALSGLTGFSGTAFWRGGTGVAFGNRQAAGFSFGILFANDRSELDGSIPMFGYCDGTHPGVDQNTAGQSGWRCRDQPGVGYDATQWNHSPVGAWNQVPMPIYLWNNLTGSSPMNVSIDSVGNATQHLQANREYYNQVSSFTGTAGVGVGPVAARPSSCTAGVAYWATDEGEWNGLQGGPDGRLYKCTAANTWTLYYTPHPYPHPWAGGAAGTPTLPAPKNLKVVP